MENVENKDSIQPIEETTATEELATGNNVNFDDDLHGENLTERAKVLSPTMTVIKRFFRSKLSIVGLATLIILFLFSFVGPVFSPWSADGGTVKDYNPNNIKLEYLVNDTVEYEVNGQTYTYYDITTTMPGNNIKGDINIYHWMGTDANGYDVFTRLMYGGQVSLTLGLVVVIIETLLGVLLGGLAGFFGKWVDQLIMRIVDILSCIPSIPIMLILSALLDSLGLGDSIEKLYLMMVALTLMGWTGTARLVRGQILSLREQEFMLAAKCSGLSTSSKIFKHLMPNVIPQLIVSMTLGLGSIILTEATLGYLGIGAPINTATWGNLINLASDDTRSHKHGNLGKSYKLSIGRHFQTVLSKSLVRRGCLHYSCNFGVQLCWRRLERRIRSQNEEVKYNGRQENKETLYFRCRI